MIFISTDILNPYKREIVSQDSYKTLIDFLQDKYHNGFKRPTDVSINGIEIAIDDYDSALGDDDIVVLLDRAALPVGLIGGWFITALANLAISVTLSYVANKLFAPDAPSEQLAPSSVYNINNAQNTARFGSPIPIIYGKVRMFPSMIVQPYYKFEDDIEYLYHLLCVGQGSNTVDEIFIGSDSITSTGDLDWKLLYQDSFYNIPVNGYGVHITKTLTNPSLMEIEVGDGESEKYTVSRDAEFIEFDYMYPNGLIYYESDGEDTSAKTSFIMKLYTFNCTSYSLVESETFYKNVRSIDAIQITHRIDVSEYDQDVYISFEKTLNKASSFYITNTVIKRVKAIYPNEDFTSRYGDITLIAVKIKATDAVSAVGQVKVNGYFERTDVGNTMSEVLTDLYTNTNYGGGLSSSDLDFQATEETVNCAYETNTTIFDAMRRPALAQGYSLYLAGMDIILKKDGANNITSAMYNEMNILRGSFKSQYLFKEEHPAHDGFKCNYIDGCGWIQRSETYPSTSTRPQVVDLFGVVDYTIDCKTGGLIVVAPETGWYTITMNSDTFGDYDADTFTYSDGLFMGGNITIDSSLDLQSTGFYLNNVFKSNITDASHLVADRNTIDQTDANYRCNLTWDKATRTWNRTDDVDYYLYPVNQPASYSHSLGVMTSDPRFLVHISDPDLNYDQSGTFSAYPKLGLIWLFAGEAIGEI